MRRPSERSVRVATLKAKLSEYIRAARRGHPVVVYDRDTPVARLVPYETGAEPLPARKPVRSLREVQFPPPLGRKVDSLAALFEERNPDR
jgi:prevent-host-death family protein